jgi:hypothetical protein
MVQKYEEMTIKQRKMHFFEKKFEKSLVGSQKVITFALAIRK